MPCETEAISVSQAQAKVIIAFAVVAYYNTIETFIIILSTFKHRRGRYFWAMVVANTGTNINVIAFVLRYFSHHRVTVLASKIIIPVAWYCMVTGQALVLWSRLHLVFQDRRKIRMVLVMIVFNAVTVYIPKTVIFYLANAKPHKWTASFNIYEKIELIAFTIQETIISFFLYKGYESLKPLSTIRPRAVTIMVRHLVALLAVVFLLDTSLVVLEYSDHFEIQTMCKPFVYSVKLKVEFVVLNKLLAFTHMSTCNCHGPKTIPSATLAEINNTCTTTAAGGIIGGGGTDASAKEGGPGVLDIEHTGGSFLLPRQTIPNDYIFDGRIPPTTRTRSQRS
ncbi:integral membrane protein [Colletotrichum cereale]|nr:integral membrane protein [Colletotrichum cereale]